MIPSPVLKFASKIATRKWFVIAVFFSLAGALSATVIPNLLPFFDPTGIVSTYNTNGPIREDGPFFQSLGPNGRSCGSCHQVSDAMGLGVQNIRARFALTHGQDPLFASIDGAKAWSVGVCRRDGHGSRARHCSEHDQRESGVGQLCKPRSRDWRNAVRKLLKDPSYLLDEQLRGRAAVAERYVLEDNCWRVLEAYELAVDRRMQLA